MTETVLLCPPIHFDVVYSINPWMKGESVDKQKAMHQWKLLRAAIENWGVRVKSITQPQHLPDIVFTANAGTVRGDRVVLSNFRFPERQEETDFYEEWFQNEGYETYHLDTCFCLLNQHCAMYYPGAFTPSAIKKLKKNIPDLIPIDVTDAAHFACNSVVYQNQVLMPLGPQKIVKELEIRGYEVTHISTSEFLKSGGSLQCMTLWI